VNRLRPYFRYLATVRGPIIAAIGFGAIFGISSGAALPSLLKYVFPVIFARRDLTGVELALIASAIPAVFLIRAFSGFGNSYFTQLAGTRILEAMRVEYFDRLQRLPLAFLQNRASGDLLSRGLADTAQLQYTLTLIANDGIKQPMQFLGVLVFLGWQAATDEGTLMVLVSLAAVPLVVFPIRYVGRKVTKRAGPLQAQIGQVASQFSENLSAAREVRAFGLEERESRRFGEASRRLVELQMKIVKYAQALTPAIEFISAVGVAASLVVAYVSGVTFETFSAIILAIYMGYEPIKKLGSLNAEMKRGTAALERLEMVLHEPVTIADPEKPIAVGRLAGDIAFEDVTFSYVADQVVLRNVTASIPPGTICALVGPSGAGKSTFANLVPRFYEAVAGRVIIDGHNVRAMRLADLRRNIAIVSQEPVLFDDTIFNNLLLGRTDATRQEVEQAARDAFAHDFITALPQGYETRAGERGGLLSGGQKQRIAIARAFLRNAPILILDEATSALDSDSEAAVQAALAKLVVGKTVLIIAHRFSTIRSATAILVFDKGEIVARGTHQELYASHPLYRSLYDRQTGFGA